MISFNIEELIAEEKNWPRNCQVFLNEEKILAKAIFVHH